MTMPAIPMAVPRFSGGKISMGTTATNGICTPAPAACRIRPTIKISNVGAIAQRTVPAMNTPIDAKNSFRVGNLSIRYADTGTMMPLTNMYMLVTHCAVPALI